MRIKSSWWTQRWTLHSNYPINDWHAYYTVAPKSSAYDLLFIEWKRVPTVKQCKLNCWAVIITQRAVDEERHSTKHLPPFQSSTFDRFAIICHEWQPHQIGKLCVAVAQNQQHIAWRLLHYRFDYRKAFISFEARSATLTSPHHRPFAARFA